MMLTISLDKMNSAKRILLTAGAILSFAILFGLFCLIFYQLFKPNSQNGHHHHQSSRFVSHRSAQSHRQNRPSPSTSTTPKPSSTSSSSGPPPHHHFDPAESISNWAKFKRLWKSGGEKERAQLLVQNVNMNPNSTWNAQVNKYTIGLKPLSEMVNFTENFDPLNSTFMMDPERLKRIEKYMEKTFFPFYERHLVDLERRKDPIPERFNAAQRWGECAQSILRVRDQGGCGSCWALAAISVMSDRICIASEGRIRDGLSAQQLVECCDYCGGCTGAPNSFFPFLYWHQEGLVSDQCFPYTIARDCGYPCPPSEFQHPRGIGHCTLGQKRCANPAMKPKRFRAKYVYKLGSLDEEEITFFPESLQHRWKLMMGNSTGGGAAGGHPQRRSQGKINDTVDLLKRELMAHGPVMLCFSVFESFMHYRDGVYNFDLQPGELHVYDHCAKVIGWGRQRRPNAIGVQPYLIAVNSWSSLWAKDGTFKIDLERLSHFHSDLFAGIP